MKKRDIELMERAKKTLLGNIYTGENLPWGDYRLIGPGPSTNFPGVWNWDCAFHAIGLLDIDLELAKEQITGYLQFLQEDGILPEFVFADGTMYPAYSDPPVMMDAAWQVYQASGDMEFLKEVYPKLTRHADYWTEQRLHDGLHYYDANKDKMEGCPEDYYTLVCWESGWDNSPRWDKGDAMFLWTIDLNCYLVMAYRALTLMANELGLPQEAAMWKEKEQALAALVEEKLFDPQGMTYADYNFRDGAFSTVLTPASFMPLFAGIASKEHAEAMNEIAKKHFLPGMPCVSYNDPAYQEEGGYWRGATWFNIAYFAAKGLKDYGYTETAEIIRETLLGWVEKDGDCIHENYRSRSGVGQNYPHFSWGSVFVREFIKNI